MKAIMKSLKPKTCANIMNLIQSILVIKSKREATAIQRLIDENGYADICVYCTKDKKEYLVKGNGEADLISRMYDKNYVPKPKKFELYNFDDGGYSAQFYDFFNGKVMFKFRCYKVEEIDKYPSYYKINGFYYTSSLSWDKLEKVSCLSFTEINDYLKAKVGYAIHISDLEIFDKPKELSEFRHSHCDNFIKNVKVVLNAFDDYVFQYFNNEKCCKCKHYNSDSNDCLKSFKPLTKAPRNFVYVEVE